MIIDNALGKDQQRCPSAGHHVAIKIIVLIQTIPARDLLRSIACGGAGHRAGAS
jgi:hypothetical protein